MTTFTTVFIQAIVYSGKEKDAHHQIDSQDFTGPLDQQIIQTMRLAKRYNAVAAGKDIGISMKFLTRNYV